MATPRRKSTDIPKHIVEAIERAWPDGVVDMPIDSEDAYFWDIYPKLKRDLMRIKGANLLYEREPAGEPHADESPDRDESLPLWVNDTYSYHVFFISPADEKFAYETETMEPDENDVEQKFPGRGTVGCVVGISLVAPFGAVRPDTMEHFESGSRKDPDIEPHIFSMAGEEVDRDDFCRDLVNDDGLQVLNDLRRKITRILESHGIMVLPEEELRKPVPWVRPGKEVFLGEGIKVREAFFFHGP